MRTIAEEYAKAYSDKTRIYFIEKYLSTFNADKERELHSCYSQDRRHSCTASQNMVGQLLLSIDKQELLQSQVHGLHDR